MIMWLKYTLYATTLNPELQVTLLKLHAEDFNISSIWLLILLDRRQH